MEQQTELTQLHGRVIDALNYTGIDHLDEWIIEVEGEEFQLDCYLPSYHACIEADGPSHGMRGKRDIRRDAVLLTIGIPTLRVRWELVEQETTEGLAKLIRRWVAAWQGSKPERRNLMPNDSIRRVLREECTCPDDCPRHEDIRGL